VSFPRDYEDCEKLSGVEAPLAFVRVFGRLRDYFFKESPQDALSSLIYLMDNLDQDDFWGTEGWRHYFLGED
jgi:hypothetical protein